MNPTEGGDMEGTGLYSGLKMLQVEDVNSVKSLSAQ